VPPATADILLLLMLLARQFPSLQNGERVASNAEQLSDVVQRPLTSRGVEDEPGVRLCSLSGGKRQRQFLRIQRPQNGPVHGLYSGLVACQILSCCPNPSTSHAFSIKRKILSSKPSCNSRCRIELREGVCPDDCCIID
jgi:hypothetical protein